MKTHFRNFIAVLALIVVVYIVTNYAGMIQQQVGVKGASTVRGQNIAGQISNDVGTQVDSAKDQAMHLNLSDVMNYISHFKRVPQDISSIRNYAQDQINNMLESKNSETKQNKNVPAGKHVRN
jgi:hypothetical protein